MMLIILILASIFLIKKLYDMLGQENDNYHFSKNEKSEKIILNDQNIVEIEKINEKERKEEDMLKNLDEESFENYNLLIKENKNFTIDLFLEVSHKIIQEVINNLKNKNNNDVKALMTERFWGIYSNMRNQIKEEIYLISINNLFVSKIIKNDNFFLYLTVSSIQQSVSNGDVFQRNTKEIWEFRNEKNSYKWLLNDIKENEDI